MKKIFNILWGTSIATLSAISCAFAYTQEQQEAYQWAYKYGITTQPTIEDAKMNSPITRQAFAKMVVNYLENVVGVRQPTSNSCYFPDENKITNDLKPYTKKSCTYEIIGKNGSAFKPTDNVNRAQLGTVFSRILWGDTYNANGKGYYIYHLNALKYNGIMNNINNPTGSFAKRGDVMIMLKRLYEKYGSNVYLNGNSSSAYDSNLNQNLNNNTNNLNQTENNHTGNSLLNPSTNDSDTENDVTNGEVTFYYENGQIRSKGYLKNGLEDGKWFYYYENGKIEAQGYYKDGEMDGEWSFYYEDGKIYAIENYKDGELDGQAIYYYENGKIEAQGYYKDGEVDGEWSIYYEDGKTYSIENYKGGELDGQAIYYYENGKNEAQGYYKDGEMDGEWSIYYEDGIIYAIENYENGELNGQTIYYDEDGNGYICNYVNGDLNGECYIDNEKLDEQNNLDSLYDGRLLMGKQKIQVSNKNLR